VIDYITVKSSVECREKITYTVADLRDFHGFPDVRPFEEDARAMGPVVDSGPKFPVIEMSLG
jgi:hypothetical protein